MGGYKGNFGGRGGFGGGGNNMQALLKQAQQMQQQMEKAQEELEETEVSGTSGGGLVEVTMNGKKEMLSVKIQPEAVDPEDVEMLEDTVMAAVNEALRLAAETTEKEMGKLTGGFNIPGLF